MVTRPGHNNMNQAKNSEYRNCLVDIAVEQCDHSGHFSRINVTKISSLEGLHILLNSLLLFYVHGANANLSKVIKTKLYFQEHCWKYEDCLISGTLFFELEL